MSPSSPLGRKRSPLPASLEIVSPGKRTPVTFPPPPLRRVFKYFTHYILPFKLPTCANIDFLFPKNQKTTPRETEQKIKILLCQAVIKKDNFEWIVQKCTELGVEEFVPLIAERSEKKNLNIERLRVIGKEAAEQSGRAFITKIHEPVTLEDALAGTKNDSIVFDASGSPLHNSSAIIHNSCSVFIGPEGGWSERELELFKQRGVKIFSLGNATLRAETAAISASALMLL